MDTEACGQSPGMSTDRLPPRRRFLAPIVVMSVMAVAGCESEGTPGSNTNGFDGGTPATTSSLPGPQYTAAPNPNAGGDGAPVPTGQP